MSILTGFYYLSTLMTLVPENSNDTAIRKFTKGHAQNELPPINGAPPFITTIVATNITHAIKNALVLV